MNNQTTHAVHGANGQGPLIAETNIAVQSQSDLESQRWGDLIYFRRTINQFTRRFDPGVMENFITERLAQTGRVRVLEIGFGDGRALLELRLAYPQPTIEFHGINLEPNERISRKEDFIPICEEMGVCSAAEAAKFNLPTPYFYDAGEGLHFEDETIDLIISQVAFHYVADKARLTEDIWRVLAPDGLALVHADSFNYDMPDFMNPGVFKPLFTPRWVIYDGNSSRIDTAGYIASVVGDCSIGLVQSRYKDRQTNLVARKNRRSKIHLGLTLDPKSTLPILTDPRPEKDRVDDGVWWGARSVFRIASSGQA